MFWLPPLLDGLEKIRSVCWNVIAKSIFLLSTYRTFFKGIWISQKYWYFCLSGTLSQTLDATACRLNRRQFVTLSVYVCVQQHRHDARHDATRHVVRLQQRKLVLPFLPMPAVADAWVSWSVTCVSCLSVCVACFRALIGKRLELPIPNWVDKHVIRSGCIDPEVKRSKVKVTLLSNALPA